MTTTSAKTARMRAIVLTSDTRDHEVQPLTLNEAQKRKLDSLYSRVFGLTFDEFQQHQAQLTAELEATIPTGPVQPLVFRDATEEEEREFRLKNPQFYERLSRQSSGLPDFGYVSINDRKE